MHVGNTHQTCMHTHYTEKGAKNANTQIMIHFPISCYVRISHYEWMWVGLCSIVIDIDKYYWIGYWWMEGKCECALKERKNAFSK